MLRYIKATSDGIVTLKDMNTDVMPVVDFGCYGGPLSTILEDVFVWDAVDLDAFDPNSEYYGEVANLIADKYDGVDDFSDQVLAYAPETIQEAFNEYGIAAEVVGGSCKWHHPSYYNYSDDVIVFDMKVDTDWVESKFMELKDDPTFKKFLKDNFSSRSGFISYMPDDSAEYEELLDPNGSEYWKLVSAIVQYLVNSDKSIREDITYELIEDLQGNANYVTISEFDY